MINKNIFWILLTFIAFSCKNNDTDQSKNNMTATQNPLLGADRK